MRTKEFVVTDELIASKGQRLANYFLDLIIQYAFVFFIGVFAALFSEMSGEDGASSWLEAMGPVEEYLFGAVIMILYYSLTETLFAKTIGKMITKTVVVMEDGSKPPIGSIFSRTLCRLIPFEHLTFLKESSRGWHDSISETYVVDQRKFEESKNLHYAFEEIGEQPTI